jgi:hypothetical protein
MALFERAQRQHGLRPLQAPALPLSFHAGLDHRPAGRLHHAGPHGPALRQVYVVLHPAPVVVEERNAFGRCRFVRICRRPPMTYPTRPRSIAVSFCCTQRFPCWEPSRYKALAVVQRELMTCMMSRTNVTRFHGLKSLVASLHRPSAPSSRTTKGWRCWGSRRSASALMHAMTSCFVRTKLARRLTCRALGASSRVSSRC